MSNVTPIKKRGESARPNNLFLLTKCVEIFGVLDAAILADLYYWIAKGDEPWRKAQDHADLFAVEEKCIRRHSRNLAIKYKCFGRKDSMLKNGKKGACKYFPIKSENSKALRIQYTALFNQGFKKTDFGKLEDDEVIEIPKFTTLPVAYIKRLKDLTMAYLLARLHWIAFSEDPSLVFRFRTQIRLANAMHLNRTTMMRYLNSLQQKAYLTHVTQNNGITITINADTDLYGIMDDWITNNQEIRKEIVMEGNY